MCVCVCAVAGRARGGSPIYIIGGAADLGPSGGMSAEMNQRQIGIKKSRVPSVGFGMAFKPGTLVVRAYHIISYHAMHARPVQGPSCVVSVPFLVHGTGM